MEGVLEAATAWCMCKLASSLLVLPWLPASRNAVSFCCCCLLVFSDVAITGEFRSALLPPPGTLWKTKTEGLSPECWARSI